MLKAIPSRRCPLHECRKIRTTGCIAAAKNCGMHWSWETIPECGSGHPALQRRCEGVGFGAVDDPGRPSSRYGLRGVRVGDAANAGPSSRQRQPWGNPVGERQRCTPSDEDEMEVRVEPVATLALDSGRVAVPASKLTLGRKRLRCGRIFEATVVTPPESVVDTWRRIECQTRSRARQRIQRLRTEGRDSG